MDSRTHVDFAAKLLAIAGADHRLSLISLFPQIDRHPPTLHRMYAHTVFKAQAVTQTGLRVLSNDHSYDAQYAFEARRFKEEQARFLVYAGAERWPLPGIDLIDREAVLLAYVSHLYLDTYNQPTQPFAPRSVYCSGQWALWEKLGDFRLKLYTTATIDNLRQDLFANKLWQTTKPCAAIVLTQAMLVRMCAHSLGRISETLVAPAMGAMGLPVVERLKLTAALTFLEEFEEVLNALHLQHLLPSSAQTEARRKDSALEAHA